MYVYKALVTKVYDGDTITCDIDLGFSVVLKDQKIRLRGINAPEVKGKTKEEGKKVRDILHKKLVYKKVTIKTYRDKKEKFGRWLADVMFDDEPVTVNQWLLNEGHAVPFMQDDKNDERE